MTETLKGTKATTMKPGMIARPTPEFAAAIAQTLGLEIAPPEIEWLTVKQVAHFLQVTIRTVYNMIAEGRLPACRISSTAIRVHRGNLHKCFDPIPPADYEKEDQG